MFNLESYITPILLSYVDKYVKDFKPADAQVSLWGGGVVLHNLVLKTDVLQDEVSLPFTLVSSRIHELLISVPWTKIISEPIVVTIDTIECILSLRTEQPDEKPAKESHRSNTQVVEAPPGYMQALVRRIVNNIAIRVHHLIVKYVHDDIVLSLNVKHVFIDSAGDKWEPAFADIDPNVPIIRRLVTLDDLTLCLDKTDSDGKIRFYQDPLLYRCHLAFRISTKLVSANTRRATDIDFQLRSEKLAWGVTADQLQLLLRLACELSADETNNATLPSKSATSQPSHHLLGNGANSAEPARSESWSEWAWSWMPSWKDREGGFEGNSKPNPPVSFSFSAYLDKVSLAVKIMENESSSRKRSRTFLELCATHAAVRAALCVPTLLHVKFGIRDLVLKSVGKCSCGHKDLNCLENEATIYLSRKNYNNESNNWEWPQKDLKPEILTATEVLLDVKTASKTENPHDSDIKLSEVKREKTKSFSEMEIPVTRKPAKDIDDLWHKMSPLIYFHLSHERSPPRVNMNPFENAPQDFEYSDWEEECDLNIDLRPMDLRVCFGLIHRLQTIKQLVHVIHGHNKERPMQKLTVEECDALLDNLPQRRINLEIRDFRISFHPWDHSLTERPTEAPVILDVVFPQINYVVTAPLYPHRVCSAAGQLPMDAGPIYRGARLHIATSMQAIQVSICSPTDGRRRPCARIDLRFVAHILLYPEYFTRKQSILNSYTVKIREVNISGSSARLHAATQVITSLMKQRHSSSLRKTTLARDALEDEDRVALDITVEDLSVRGFITHNTISHIMTLQSVRATVFQSLSSADMKQAWLISGPDIPTSTPFVRLVIQWCDPSFKNAVDHFGLWTEPAALCIDPLFIAWLSYKPYQRHISDVSTRISASSIHLFKKRSIVSSSSGRGMSKSESNTEQVHVKSRSMASSSEPSEKKEPVSPMPQPAPQPVKHWWQGDNLLKLHERLRMMPISMDLGLMLVYVTTKTASAVDCATVRVAMEKHASHQEDVMVFSIGRWSLYSSLIATHLWHSVNHDGPTYMSTKEATENKAHDSFPWKMTLADMSCYSLEAAVSSEKESTALRSQLKQSATVRMRNILELVTTTVTLSVETKSVLYKTFKKPTLGQRSKPLTKDELKIKYFTAGSTFKPSTLKEFLRGPLRQKKEDKKSQQAASSNDEETSTTAGSVPNVQSSKTVFTAGPIVSLGFNLHADTPPIVLKIESDQVHLVAACLHCFTHVITLAHQNPATTMTRSSLTVTTLESQAFLNRAADDVASFSETSTPSEERSELMTIYESHTEGNDAIKTFFYCQWVIGRATVVVSTEHAKIALDVDDIISTVDLEELYNQVRVKIASTTIKQFERSPDGQWTSGPLGGRVLEAREPENYKEESQFLSITVTQTQISTLPPSWKTELHPKVLEKGPEDIDMMLEIYAIIAPLEIVILPRLLDNVMSIANTLTMQSFCTLTVKEERKEINFISPFFYVNSGGLRLFLACDMPDSKQDDTLIFRIDRISVNPHPDNPICRRPVLDSDTGWNNSMAGNLEGRQYEVLVEQISIQSTNFNDLVTLEVSQDSQHSVSENPAHKWNQQVPVPTLTTILHPMSISFVLAPVLFVKGVIMCGSAFELNLTSDCALELSVDQLHLALMAASSMGKSFKKRLTCSDIRDGVCPYAQLGVSQNTLQGRYSSEYTLFDYSEKSEPGVEQGAGNATLDSGVETATSRSTWKSSTQFETPIRKSASVTFSKESYSPSDYLEIFVTMGSIDVSLYYMDDGSQDTAPIKARSFIHKKEEEEPSNSKLPTITRVPLARTKLYQPNLYYWRRKTQINIQGSLFNVWLGLQKVDDNGIRDHTVLNTAQGYIDPDTEIPPALLTIKYTTASVNTLPNVNYVGRGTLNVDIERPIMLKLSIKSLLQISAIGKLLAQKLTPITSEPVQTDTIPVLYKLRRFMVKQVLDVITIQTSQFGLCLSEGTLGYEVMSLQVAWRGRPETIMVRGLIHALVVSCGHEQRIPIMQPVHVGALLEAIWEAWRRVEGPSATKEPTILFNIDVDAVIFDIQPDNLYLIRRIMNTLKQLKEEENSDDADKLNEIEESEINANPENQVIASGTPSELSADHYYKDDLRSGAFKIEFGTMLPMAYQVILGPNQVAWRYPHPRAITRLVLYPLPDLDQEVDCALECYNRVLSQWEPHTFVKLPVNEAREIALHVQPPEAIFSSIWRFRVLLKEPEVKKRFYFDLYKFLPKTDPWTLDPEPEHDSKCNDHVTGEQLSGVLRVDSYFASKLAPKVKVSVRLADFQIHAHNSVPQLPSFSSSLEGYYVSKQLQRSHRVLSLIAQGTYLGAQLGSQAGSLFVFNANLSCELLDCSTGTMDNAIESFQVHGGVSIPDDNVKRVRGRLSSGTMVMSLHVPRLRTLQALAADWQSTINKLSSENTTDIAEETNTKEQNADDVAKVLEGRISLWIHNSCSIGFRVGQDETEEIIQLEPGVTLAYRWRKRSAPKRLRFALATPVEDWQWSKSVPFTVGETRVRLERLQTQSRGLPTPGECLYVEVKQVDAHRNMHLSGRLVLANMLRFDLNYKVRMHTSDNVWQSLASGEMPSEEINQSVLCSPTRELVLKIKLMRQNTGWSGDIPLKECPKENVPWLVKVPSEGDMPYMSVWCRVVRARSDGRILATIWPLYVLHSALTLDTDLLLTTDMGVTSSDVHTTETAGRPPPIIQTAPGRGASTHLIAPGTTSAKHSLSFQYRNIECPVTREAIPLHYGVTERSVFDKRIPVNTIDEVAQEISAWLARSGRSAVSEWPYSLVSKHWQGKWRSALLQPRCEVVVRYEAVCAGGGCSLEVQLSPVLLLCNAAPLSLTLRAHDAAPVCKLETGNVISPPTIILRKPFFMSYELERETFVSEELEVYAQDPGRYGSPPEGKVAVDHPTIFAIQCSNKVALLNLHYEIKDDINILGITSTFVLKNNLKCSLLISPVAIPNDKAPCGIVPCVFKVVPPAGSGASSEAIPLCEFWLRERWRGGKVSELLTFICLALEPKEDEPRSVPVRLGGTGLTRTAVALVDENSQSVPVVVTQHKYEGQWVVTISEDPCPQFLIYNQTFSDLAVGLPIPDYEEKEKGEEVKVVSDCPGARWWRIIKSVTATYYSTPDHCLKRSPSEEHHNLPISLSFGKFCDIHYDPNWCPPIAITDGEQLVRIDYKATIKIRVKNNPHTTIIELRDVSENDLSASVIRGRLMGLVSYESTSEAVTKHLCGQPDRLRNEELLLTGASLLQRKMEIEETSLALKKQLKEACENFRKEFKRTSTPSHESSHVASQRRRSSTTREVPSIHSDNIESVYSKSSITDKKTADDKDSKRGKSLSFTGSDPYPNTSIAMGDDAVSGATTLTIAKPDNASSDSSSIALIDMSREWQTTEEAELIQCVMAGIVIKMSAANDTPALLALHVDNIAVQICASHQKFKTNLTVENIQIDNLQYDSGQFDFAVIATTQVEPHTTREWAATCNIFADQQFFVLADNQRIMLRTCHDTWTVNDRVLRELTEVEIMAGPLALYVEDAYVKALAELFRMVATSNRTDDEGAMMAEANALQRPLRLRLLYIHPLDLTLTLHTAVRIYIALDQSPLHLSAFKIQHMFTSPDRLAHALTVHYLSAAILGAGWVVGGLELLGAPGALAARVGGATGGVRGIASAAAAALLRSLSAWAGSLARNLDLLAGDEEHARRAAAARRRPPDSFMGGLVAGITNFAINILGAVGGLAHHPLVGVAVGESESGTTALRRGLLGALTKPLSATADLVAYAGNGLLKQTGWDPVPQPRPSSVERGDSPGGWRRDCVRWTFRLPDFHVYNGYEVLLDNVQLQLMLTRQFIIFANPTNDSVVEMIDLHYCKLGTCQCSIVELFVQHKRSEVRESHEANEEEEMDQQARAAVMARVARYMGAEGASTSEGRTLYILPLLGDTYNLHAALTTAIRNNAQTHFSLI